uniref:Uncharacterized protein n=1 Tax=Rhizophagus irregularis (strain DAOM 181602 / DAOM 197198 / MUCL 43194) TaxID=747089 RepID=U9TF58_RHIID
MIDMKKKLSINVTYLMAEKLTHFSSANRLYSSNKGNSYTLLDFDSLRKNNTQLQVFTNNQRIIDSDRKNVNVRFHIFKYLIAVMLALLISRGMRTKYFNKLRALLIEKYQLLIKWLEFTSSRNNETTTYIRFSVRHITWYFSFKLPCNICAITMSKNRKVYWKCKKQVIQQLPKVPLENAVFKDLMYKKKKEIYLPQRGISFVKQLAYKDKKLYKYYEGSTPI